MIFPLAAMVMAQALATPPKNPEDCQHLTDAFSAMMADTPMNGYSSVHTDEAHYNAATGICYVLMHLKVMYKNQVAELGALLYQFGKDGVIAEIHWSGKTLKACQVNGEKCSSQDAFDAATNKLFTED